MSADVGAIPCGTSPIQSPAQKGAYDDFSSVSSAPFVKVEMMILEVRTNINAPASKIFSFFNEMQENYVRWHPDHVLFKWRRGRGVAPGNVFYFEEMVADEYQKQEVVFTEVTKDRYLAFAPTGDVFRLVLPRISFEMNEGTQSTELIAQVVARMGPIAVWVYRRKIRRIIQHMRQEGENLKQLVETSAV